MKPSETNYISYRNLPGHYRTMVDGDYNAIGISHFYVGKVVKKTGVRDAIFDNVPYFGLVYDCYFIMQ